LLKEYLQRPDHRLATPLVFENGDYREADWDSVLSRLAERLSSYGPSETAVLMDAGLTNEELFCVQKFARTVLKTHLVGCPTPAGEAAMEEAIRRLPSLSGFRGSLSRLPRAGSVLALGINPPACQPVAGTILRRAVLDGARLVTANPLSIGIGRYADLHLSHFPGTETVLLAGLAHLILQALGEPGSPEPLPGLDLQALREHLAPYGPEAVARLTGVHAEQLIEAACVLRSRGPLAVLVGPGAAASMDSRDALHGMFTLLQLTGSTPESGGGILPLFGKGNATGAADLGLVSPMFGIRTAAGEALVQPASQMGEILASGRIKAVLMFFDSLGRSLLESVRPSLQGLELVVLHDIVHPNAGKTSISPEVHLALPMASALEKDGTFTTSDGSTLTLKPVISPPGSARSAVWVVQQLARHMKAQECLGDSEEALRRKILEELESTSSSGMKLSSTASVGCCGAGAAAPGASGGGGSGLGAWKPASPPPVTCHEQEHPFQIIPKDVLEPYFVGPLQAEETRAVFFPEGEIELNPADAFRLELSPGETVRIVTVSGSCQGRLAQNPLLASGMVMVPMNLYRSLFPETEPQSLMTAGRVERTK